jgi:hypothetical protein
MECLRVRRLVGVCVFERGRSILTIDVVVQSIVRQFEGRELGVRVPLELVVSTSNKWAESVDGFDLQLQGRHQIRARGIVSTRCQL